MLRNKTIRIRLAVNWNVYYPYGMYIIHIGDLSIEKIRRPKRRREEQEQKKKKKKKKKKKIGSIKVAEVSISVTISQGTHKNNVNISLNS